MLHLAFNRKASLAAVPANISTLSVSWLNGQVKAVAVQRGMVEGTWEYAGEIENGQQFDRLLREAIQHTGYRGTTVSLVLAHPRLSQQLLETPPLRGPLLAKFVQGQARQQKLFEGEAASAYQPAYSPEGTQRLVLHLFPRAFLDQLVGAAQRNDVFLTSVVPATAVLQSQLSQLAMDKDGIAVLAANMGNSTLVIIGRSDGQILLARTLGGSWTTDAPRLAVDLSRTILFVNQQYGVAVDKGLWLFGANSKEHFLELQRHIQVPVKLSPVEHAPFYWATDALKLPVGQTPNFISLELQRAPQRRTMLKLTTAITALSVTAAASGSVWCRYQIRAERSNLENLSQQAQKLQARHQDLQRLQTEMLRKQDAIRQVVERRAPPVPAWFTATLAETLPSSLTLTNLEVRREPGVWRVRLAGVMDPAAAAADPAAGGPVATLKSRLQGAPFHLRLIEEPPTNRAAASASPFAGWFAKDSRGRGEPLPGFTLEGVMR